MATHMFLIVLRDFIKAHNWKAARTMLELLFSCFFTRSGRKLLHRVNKITEIRLLYGLSTDDEMTAEEICERFNIA